MEDIVTNLATLVQNVGVPTAYLFVTLYLWGKDKDKLTSTIEALTQSFTELSEKITVLITKFDERR